MEFVEMKDRIAHIIRAKNLTAAEFATQLGIQPSNISHLLSGRNNPSLDFVKKLKETFPEYNLDWIVFGKGPMTVSEPFIEPKSQQETVEIVQPKAESEASKPSSFPISAPMAVADVAEASFSATDSRQTKVVFVYDDNTFEVFRPR